MDLIFGVIIAWIFYTAARAAWATRDIKVKATMSGKIISACILFGAIAVAFWLRYDAFQYFVPLVLFTVITFVVFLLGASGLSEEGMVFNGKLVPFERMHYFTFEFEADDPFCLRVNDGKKDYSLFFKQAKAEQVKAYLALGTVTFQETKQN